MNTILYVITAWGVLLVIAVGGWLAIRNIARIRDDEPQEFIE